MKQRTIHYPIIMQNHINITYETREVNPKHKKRRFGLQAYFLPVAKLAIVRVLITLATTKQQPLH